MAVMGVSSAVSVLSVGDVGGRMLSEEGTGECCAWRLWEVDRREALGEGEGVREAGGVVALEADREPFGEEDGEWMRRAGFGKVLYVDPRDVYLSALCQRKLVKVQIGP